jgi:hypothetical protein|tara:strand:+ start:948 stop:1097 length:150 start_codon:yes stop_codon:yes gene_type:complete
MQEHIGSIHEYKWLCAYKGKQTKQKVAGIGPTIGKFPATIILIKLCYLF